MHVRVALLPGDGIGVEVTNAATRVLDAVGREFGHQFEYTSDLIGGSAIDAAGTALPAETVAACQAADAVLLGAVGGPQWDNPKASVRPEQGLLGLRAALGVFANLRPVRVHPSLADALTACDVAPARWPSFAKAFASLTSSEIVRER